jgi:hypothetical protein
VAAEQEALQAVLEPAPTAVEAAELAAEEAGEYPVAGQVVLPDGGLVAVLPDDETTALPGEVPVPLQPHLEEPRGVTPVITLANEVPAAEPEFPEGSFSAEDERDADSGDFDPYIHQ